MRHFDIYASHGESMIERTFFPKCHTPPKVPCPKYGVVYMCVCVCVSMYIANILWLVELIGSFEGN